MASTKVLIGSVGTLAVVAAWIVLFPALYGVNRLEDVRPQEEKPEG